MPDQQTVTRSNRMVRPDNPTSSAAPAALFSPSVIPGDLPDLFSFPPETMPPLPAGCQFALVLPGAEDPRSQSDRDVEQRWRSLVVTAADFNVLGDWPRGEGTTMVTRAGIGLQNLRQNLDPACNRSESGAWGLAGLNSTLGLPAEAQLARSVAGTSFPGLSGLQDPFESDPISAQP